MQTVLADTISRLGLPPWLEQYVVAMAILLVIYAGFLLVERLRPVEKLDWSSVWLNLRLALLLQAVMLLLAIWLQPMLSNAVSGWFPDGTGLIKTASYRHFWQQAALFILYLLAYDFFYYWLHRAQHRYDALWSIHKLHHSETHVNVTTTYRVHWLEEFLKAAVIVFPIGLIFDAIPAAGWLAAVLSLWLFFVHANLRVSFGPLSWLLTSPASHRIHHSLDHAQSNSNFAVIFPIWDVLFGTYRAPVWNAWPKTGVAGEQPPGFWRAISEPLVFSRGVEEQSESATTRASAASVLPSAKSEPIGLHR